jgi:hypothetical protein
MATALMRRGDVNNPQHYNDVLTSFAPWAGHLPKGFLVDFLGTRVRAEFRAMFGVDPTSVGGGHTLTRPPRIADGRTWFSAVNSIAAARDARERYTMMALGATYGAPAIGAYHALQRINPLPCKLVAVEPEPGNFAWMLRSFRDNGIDPDAHWLLQAVVGDTNEPVLFPVGAPGVGAQNCVASNEPAARKAYADELVASGRAEEGLCNLLLRNTTGISRRLEGGFAAEIRPVSSVTLADLLAPLDAVDYLECDIQQSEVLVFPPAMEQVRRKVRRLHIATHGGEVHSLLHGLFERQGWELVFSYAPNATHDSPLGSFDTNDGMLSVKNPSL